MGFNMINATPKTNLTKLSLEMTEKMHEKPEIALRLWKVYEHHSILIWDSVCRRTCGVSRKTELWREMFLNSSVYIYLISESHKWLYIADVLLRRHLYCKLHATHTTFSKNLDGMWPDFTATLPLNLFTADLCDISRNSQHLEICSNKLCVSSAIPKFSSITLRYKSLNFI